MDGLSHEIYMHRCLQLAKLGSGAVAPNPMVGAVLVHKGMIIGEGYHQKYGEAHAEVNCLNSVGAEHRQLIEQSTLYVSLEPCAHFGKTPPCADLIVRSRIPRVVVGCRDPFVQVDGKGIEKLNAAGVEVVPGVLENECRQLNKRFFAFHTKHRPYVVLKWAQTADQKMANAGSDRLHITNEYSNRMVHKWRSQEMAIVVGTNTALYDDPQLTTRLWPGKNPIRIVVDRDLRLPLSLKVFDGSVPTIVFNTQRHSLEAERFSVPNGVHYYQVTEDVSLVQQMLHALYRMNIQSLFVEGGAYLLQSFIDEEVWDEARIITNEQLIVADGGLAAPVLRHHLPVHAEQFFSDAVRIYHPLNSSTF